MSDLYRPLKEGYEFNGSEFFSEGWELFKKEAGSFVGVTVLFIVINVVVAFIPFVNLLGTFIQMTLFGGYYIYCRNMQSGDQKMGDFFGAFNSFGQIVLYLIVLGLMILPVFFIALALVVPYEELIALIGNTDDPGAIADLSAAFMENIGMMIILFFAFIVYAVYLSMSYIFVLPLIVDSKMGFWQAMELSRKVVGKQFFSFFGFYFIIGILSGLFVLVTLFFGVLVLYPVLYCVSFVMYNRIFKLDEESEVDEIESFGQSNDDINTESQEQGMGH